MKVVAERNSLLAAWQRSQRLPGGRWLFGRLLGRKVPYSGTIRARVEALAPGSSTVRMADRRSLRNHFHSLHAVALTNLGELASGLAMTAALPPEARGIPVRITIEFLKKARGEIVAEGRCAIPDWAETAEHEARASLRDADGDEVARFTAHWIVGPKA